MKRLIVICALVFAPVPALAHKVIAGVFPAGDAIEGELGFSSGDMAVGQEVIVTGPDGEELGRVMTDADGFFLFIPTRPVAHTFYADMGAGHVAEITMSAQDVARIIGVSPEPSSGTPVLGAADPETKGRDPAPTAVTEAQRQAIARAVRDEVRPLRREIAAYREHNDLQTVLGGIGYIMGLFGLGFYLAARRKMKT